MKLLPKSLFTGDFGSERCSVLNSENSILFDFPTPRQSIRPSDPERLATERPEVACQLLRAFTLDASGIVLVSEQVHGTTSFDETLLWHHGSGVHLLLRAEWRTAPAWSGTAA